MSKATKGLQTAKFKIKKGDTVVIISGKDKGKTGKVERVIREDAKVVVEGVGLVKRHNRGRFGQTGQIVEKPAAIAISNVMLHDPKEKKGTRVKRVVNKDGKRERVTVKSGTTLG
jgi:large subunit ribosomal protein L24